MGHNSVVSGHLTSTGVPRVNGLSMGPSDLGHHSCVPSNFRDVNNTANGIVQLSPPCCATSSSSLII